MNPLIKALIAELLGAAALLVLTRGTTLPPLPGLALAALQGGLAAVAGLALRLPRWWLPILAGFTPLIVLATQLQLPPAAWAGAFLVLLLTFWRTDTSQVPLYLSNRATAAAVARLIPNGAMRVIDLGCGSGSLLCRLAQARPDCHFVGIEHAPLTWLFARWRSRRARNIDVRRGNFWPLPLAAYDVAYAFLSPVPMPRLWRKACEEMLPGSLLIANSFEIPGIVAENIIDVADRRQTRLYCYRIPPRPAETGNRRQ